MLRLLSQIRKPPGFKAESKYHRFGRHTHPHPCPIYLTEFRNNLVPARNADPNNSCASRPAR
jgi:hypothetical protein